MGDGAGHGGSTALQRAQLGVKGSGRNDSSSKQKEQKDKDQRVRQVIYSIAVNK